MDSLPTSGKVEDFCNTVFHADALDLLRALPDKSADMILTDFPYGVTEAHYDQVELDFASIGKELFRVIRKDGAVITTAVQPFSSKLIGLWERHFQYEWIWRKTRKTNFLNAKKMPLAAHESILVFGHKLPRYYPQMVAGERHEKRTRNSGELYGSIAVTENTFDNLFYPSSVLEFPHDSDLTKTKKQKPSKAWNHPNQKPLALWEYLVKTYSLQGEIILDPFSGSATTAIACLNLDRRYICGDLHAPYVELSRQRIVSHNPFINTPLATGEVQKSLFQGMEVLP